MRGTYRCLGAGVAVVLATSSGASSGAKTAAATGRSLQRPNVLLIVTDDQRARGTMQVMPSTRAWFGRSGRSYPNAVVTTPLCCPSRASIYTGLYAHNHGIKVSLDRDSESFRASFERSTIQRYLQDAGYLTGFYGKYLNGWKLEDDLPGFDRWAVQDEAEDYLGGLWNIDGRVEEISRYSTSFLRRQAVRFILRSERNDSRPWLMVLTPNAPHPPAIPEPRYENAIIPPLPWNPALFEEDRSDKPEYVQRSAIRVDQAAEERTDQLRTLMSVDDLIGALATALRTTGESRRTLAVFTSDNGFLWGEHGLRKKFAPYTPAVEVPLFLRWPGHVPPGSVDRRLAANIDIAPTIQAAAGIDPTRPVDGRSLLEPWDRDHILLEYFKKDSVSPWASILAKDYQYIEYYSKGEVASFSEYYDLRTDPWQLTNALLDGDPDNDPDLGRLGRVLDELKACAGSSCP